MNEAQARAQDERGLKLLGRGRIGLL
jgi:hypothetical protein